MKSNSDCKEKRIKINRAQRKNLEEDLYSYKLICSVIKNASDQKIPVKSFCCLLDKVNNLENQLNAHGLPNFRIEEIKEEIYL